MIQQFVSHTYTTLTYSNFKILHPLFFSTHHSKTQVSRSGRSASEDFAALLQLCPQVLVTCTACDMSCMEDCHAAIGKGQRMDGIIHAAGILADGLLSKQSYTTIQR